MLKDTFMAVRVGNGITIKQTSEIVGISASYLSEIENGRRKHISLNLFKRYAKAFNMKKSELMKLIELEEAGYSYQQLLKEYLSKYFKK